MTDLKYSPIICCGMSSPEMVKRGREDQRKMRNRDERIEGITTVDSKVWGSGVEYLLCCGACCIKSSQPYFMTKFFPDA